MDHDSSFQDELRVVVPPDPCPYLSEETASMEFRVIRELSNDDYDQLLALGWRRHGLHIFRPACPSCKKCRSLRVSVSDFLPSKSQRRVLRKNKRVHVTVRRPTLTEDHLRLFNRYHADMHHRKGWPHKQTSPEEYYESFLCGRYRFEREFLYVADGKLVAVGLVDVTARSASSVYFFYDPDWRKRSLGTYSMLREIDYVKQNRIMQHYLGYWIGECESMAYKNRFQPHQILKNYVPDDQIPVWEDPNVA